MAVDKVADVTVAVNEVVDVADYSFDVSTVLEDIVDAAIEVYLATIVDENSNWVQMNLDNYTHVLLEQPLMVDLQFDWDTSWTYLNTDNPRTVVFVQVQLRLA